MQDKTRQGLAKANNFASEQELVKFWEMQKEGLPATLRVAEKFGAAIDEQIRWWKGLLKWKT
jgi:hypothetical protein